MSTRNALVLAAGKQIKLTVCSKREFWCGHSLHILKELRRSTRELDSCGGGNGPAVSCAGEMQWYNRRVDGTMEGRGLRWDGRITIKPPVSLDLPHLKNIVDHSIGHAHLSKHLVTMQLGICHPR
jgi:hypothetical protein